MTFGELVTLAWYGTWYVVFGTLAEIEDAVIAWRRRRRA